MIIDHDYVPTFVLSLNITTTTLPDNMKVAEWSRAASSPNVSSTSENKKSYKRR